MKVLVDIYRSKKKEGLYIYLPAGAELKDLPADLLTNFGLPEFAMKLALDENRKLARVNVCEVLEALQSKGFFLQMPPVVDTPDHILDNTSDNTAMSDQ